MNTAAYQDIWAVNLMIPVENFEPFLDKIFQHDNGPSHIAKSSTKWLAETDVNILTWLTQSPE